MEEECGMDGPINNLKDQLEHQIQSFKPISQQFQ
jgi:hypothetical protein